MTAESLEALELSIGRRVDGLLAGDYRSAFAGVGTELYQVTAVRGRRRRPPDRLERDRPHRPDARPGRARRARPRDVARLRRLGLDVVRHHRAAQGRRRGRSRARGRAHGDTARQPPRARRFRLRRPALAPPASGAPRPAAHARRAPRRSVRERRPRRRADAARRARVAALARRDRLRLPRSDRLAQRALARRRAPPDARGRDPRPARAGARRRRRAAPRRPRDRPAAPRRHERPQAAGAVRRGGGRGAKRARPDARRRPASATSRSRPRATGCGSSPPSSSGATSRMLGFFIPFAFKSPWLLLFLLLVPARDRAVRVARPAADGPRGAVVVARPDAEHGLGRRPARAGTSRRSCSRSR